MICIVKLKTYTPDVNLTVASVLANTFGVALMILSGFKQPKIEVHINGIAGFGAGEIQMKMIKRKRYVVMSDKEENYESEEEDQEASKVGLALTEESHLGDD